MQNSPLFEPQVSLEDSARLVRIRTSGFRLFNLETKRLVQSKIIILALTPKPQTGFPFYRLLRLAGL
jgi:hypothetical protein